MPLSLASRQCYYFRDSLVPQVHLDYWGLLAPRDHWVSKGPRETRETLAAPELTVAMDKMEQQDPPYVHCVCVCVCAKTVSAVGC